MSTCRSARKLVTAAGTIFAAVLGTGAPASAQAPAPAAPTRSSTPPTELEALGLYWQPTAQLRFRVESFVDPYAAPLPTSSASRDQTFVTTRIRPGLGIRWPRDGNGGLALRARIEVQDARILGNAPAFFGSTSNGFGLFQGYVELGGDRGFARLGRQVIQLHEQRLIGGADWGMQARSVDALRLQGHAGPLALDAFGAWMAPQHRVAYVDGDGFARTTSSRGDYLAGVVGTRTFDPAFELALYTYYRHDDPTETSPRRNRDVASPGFRAHGTLVDRLEYTLEGTFQTGRVDGSLHRAYGVAGDLYGKLGTPLGLRVSGGGVIGSGASASGRIDGLDNFFPTNHGIYGFNDLMAWTNHVEGHVRLDAAPEEARTSIRLDLFQFGLRQAAAPWVNANGVTLGQSAIGSSRNLGQELDLSFQWHPWSPVAVSGGYSIFHPGPAAERLGHDEPTHWLWLMLAVQAG